MNESFPPRPPRLSRQIAYNPHRDTPERIAVRSLLELARDAVNYLEDNKKINKTTATFATRQLDEITRDPDDLNKAREIINDLISQTVILPQLAPPSCRVFQNHHHDQDPPADQAILVAG